MALWHWVAVRSCLEKSWAKRSHSAFGNGPALQYKLPLGNVPYIVDFVLPWLFRMREKFRKNWRFHWTTCSKIKNTGRLTLFYNFSQFIRSWFAVVTENGCISTYLNCLKENSHCWAGSLFNVCLIQYHASLKSNCLSVVSFICSTRLATVKVEICIFKE